MYAQQVVLDLSPRSAAESGLRAAQSSACRLCKRAARSRAQHRQTRSWRARPKLNSRRHGAALQMLKNSSFPGSKNGSGLFQTIAGLKIREVYERMTAKEVAASKVKA